MANVQENYILCVLVSLPAISREPSPAVRMHVIQWESSTHTSFKIAFKPFAPFPNVFNAGNLASG